MDEHDIPNDVIWLDIEHTDTKKYVFKVAVVA
jgi:alpha-glucosidase (family GH31 glycosyl hydrolase)